MPAPRYWLTAALGLALLLGATACKKAGLCNDEPLAIARVTYSGSSLLTTGFYYGNLSAPDFAGTSRYETQVLYRNGVVLLPGGDTGSKLRAYIDDLRASPALSQKTKYAWGAFDVSAGQIRIASWEARPGCYNSVLRTGQIRNDTSFVLTQETIRTPQGDVKVRPIAQEFVLYRYAPKPDSLNPFVQ